MPIPKKAGEAIAKRLAEDTGIDVALALNATIAGEPAVAAAKALPEGRKVRVGTFDVTDAILNAVADGAAAFADRPATLPAGLSAGPISGRC